MPSTLHVVTSPRRRGAETAAAALHAALTRRGGTGELVALAPGDDAQRSDDRLPIEVLGRTSRAPATLRSLRRRAAGHGVVVAHGADTLLACAAALDRSGPPFVYLGIGDPRRWAPGRRRLVNALAIRRAARVGALGEGSAAAFREWYRLPSDRVVVLPNFRSVEAFRPASAQESAAARRRIGVPADVPVVAVVGALTVEKRVDVAVAAALALPTAHVVVAGDGPCRPDVLRAAAAAPARVHLLGSLADVTPVLVASDVLLLASATEGVPGVLVEAALCGLPAVTTDVGWVRDVVEHGAGGRVVTATGEDLTLALAAALADLLPEARAAGARAQARARERFADDVVLPRWQSLLADVAAGAVR